MTSFEEREKAFEAKYVHDEEARFRARARRNRAVGLWAAGLLGRSGDEAGLYLADLQALAFGPHGDDALVARLAEDLAGLADRPSIEARMTTELAEAQAAMIGKGD